MKYFLFCLLMLSFSVRAAEGYDKIKVGFIVPVIKTQSTTLKLADLVKEMRGNTLDEHELWQLPIEVTNKQYIYLTEIKRLIKQSYPNLIKRVIFSGRKKAEVRLFLNTFKTQSIYDEAINFLFSKYELKKSQWVLSPLKGFSTKEFIADFDEYKFTINSNKKELKSRVAINVTFYNRHKKLREKTLWFNAQFYQPVLVFSSDINKYETEFENKVVIENRDVLRFKNKPLTHLDKLINKRTIKHVRQGKVLFSEDLEVIPTVEHNQKVTLVYEKKGLSLLMQGIAMKNGHIGDTVKVLVKEANKPVEAIVTSKNYLTVVNND